MMQAIKGFFSDENFMPHGHCFLWQSDIFWLHTISDGSIAAAYFAIPLVLLYILKKRDDMPFERIFVAFAAFILLCGMTHIMSIWVLWNPDYAIEGLLKAWTAIASLSTLVILIRLIPRILGIPSSKQLVVLNQQLKDTNLELETLHQQSKARSDSYLSAVVNTVLDGLITIDGGGIIQSFNPAAERIFGYLPDEVIGQNVNMLMPDPYHAEHDGYLRNYQATGEKKIIGIGREVEGKRKNGSIFAMELGVNEMKTSGERLFVGTVRDVTKRKEAEAALALSEERYELAVKGLSVGIWDWDCVSGDLYRSARFDEIMYFSPDEIGNFLEVWKQRLHPEDRDATVELLEKHLQQLGPFDVEYRLLGQDGLYSWIRAKGQAVWDATGKPLRMVGSIEEVSERKAAESKTSLLAAIVESSEDAIISKTLYGIISTWNRGAERIFHYTAAEAVGQPINLIIPPERLEEERAIIALVREGHPLQHFETTRMNKRGERIDIALTVSPVRDKLGNIIGASKIIRDITERKAADEARHKLMDQLMQSNTELERFAYVASHDMQEPLRMITNFTEIIATDYAPALDDTGKEYLQLVRDAGERMRDMVDDLLEYARVGNETIALKPVDGARELGHVLANLAGLIEERNAQITYDSLPHFMGNPVQFMRLLQNLITNAIKYQPVGNTPRIHVGVEDLGDQWCISVRDNGVGISEEFLQQVFQPFRRLQGWGDVKGTGIGLAVCKRIVETHGGRIWATSVPKEGSVFHCTFIKIDAQQAEAA